ncbi:MAG: DUF2332 domain-containing protein, partial [Acidimicrobiales bacterium]
MQQDGRLDLAAQFRSFSALAGRDGVPLYERIAAGVAEDRRLLSLAAVSPPEQRRPTLLLAAVHFLLLGGDDHPLAAHYRTVAPAGPGGRAPRSGDPFDDFRDFCLSRRPALEALLGTRATQTNEVGRSAALVPGLAAAASALGVARLSLLELGASAGLNLLLDHYAYDYGGVAAGDPSSPVVLHCELRHGHPQLVLPELSWRCGLDRQPVDPTDEPSARWLLACLWPDHLARFERLAAALELAAAVVPRPPIAPADMVDDLAAVAATVPADAPLCVFHTWSAAYLTAERQRSLAAAVAELARRRPVAWLFAEEPAEVPGLPVPPAPPEGRRGATALVLTTFHDRTPRSRRLADLHPHGRWLRWWADDAA